MPQAAVRSTVNRILASVTALTCAVGALTGCGADRQIRLTVFASASLAEAVTALAARHRHEHPRIRLRPVFAGSLELVDQLRDHQAADVLITADGASMDRAGDLAGPRRVVAHNAMTIVVAPGNPRRIQGTADLADPALRVVLGAPLVPVGRYARQVLTKAGVTVRPDAEEIDSAAVLNRVRTGEADAGIVYITDLRAAGAAASSVPIPAAQNVTVAYPAAVVATTRHPEESAAFIGWLTSPDVRTALGRYGLTM